VKPSQPEHCSPRTVIKTFNRRNTSRRSPPFSFFSFSAPMLPLPCHSSTMNLLLRPLCLSQIYRQLGSQPDKGKEEMLKIRRLNVNQIMIEVYNKRPAMKYSQCYLSIVKKIKCASTSVPAHLQLASGSQFGKVSHRTCLYKDYIHSTEHLETPPQLYGENFPSIHVAAR